MLKKNKNLKKLLLISVLAVFILTGVSCKGGDKAAQDKAADVKLTYWTVAANKAALDNIVNAYRIDHPNVTFEIKVIPEDQYEQALLEAWAEDKGPDIFSIRNTWTNKYLSKIEPMPASINLPYKTISGTVKKEEKWVLRTRTTYTPQTMAATFVPQVVDDSLWGSRIYGLPLSFDTLALYYNRDIFNNYNIILPPETWIPFTEAVKQITILDQNNQIVQSAVGMGTADNIDHSVDIASLIMIQNGTRMTDYNTNRVVFDEPVVKDNVKLEPAVQALLFYTDFANFAKEAYTWNATFTNARMAFINGETAMYFGYASDRQFIKKSAPGLNFEISGFPQIDGSPVKFNFANYWLETVSKKSSNIDWAWDFVVFATGKSNVEKYLNTAELPTAQRELLSSQIENTPWLAAFDNQALTAKSWYKGKQPDVAYQIFKEMITEINNGRRTELGKYLSTIVAKINQTL